ncbi:MAG: hypothetical protein AAF927_19110 [Bacteroidota bacterium]
MNTKLLEALRSLNPLEQNHFTDFVNSPYHNKRQRSVHCWQYFQNFAPDYDSNQISIQALGKHLFPTQSFKRQAVLDEISHLYRLIKSFWEAEGLQADPFLQRSLRLQQLSERGMNRLYSIERKAAQKLLAEKAPDLEEAYKYKLAWSTLDNEHFGRQQTRTVDTSLAQKLEAMDVYFLVLILRESCEASNRQHILNAQYQLPLLNPLLQLLRDPSHPYRQVPLINLYYHAYLSLQDEADETSYEALLKTLRKYRDQLSEIEKRSMYKFAQNFCIRQINSGQAGYHQRLFELFQEVLQEKIIYEEGKLSHTNFKNIVTIGLRVKAFDWVEHFLENQIRQVDLPFRENVYAYCRAALEVEIGQTQKAIRRLNSISHTDVHYQISARQLLFKIYYFDQDYEAALYTISAFRHFVQRNQELPKARKEYYTRYLNHCKALCLLQERWPAYSKPEAQMRRKKLQTKVESSAPLANRNWLLEELARFERSAARNAQPYLRNGSSS